MRVANINTNIEVMKRRIQMKTSAQMGHKYIVAPHGSMASLGATPWMAHKTICGVNIWKYWQTRLFVGKMFGNIGMYERHYVK